MLLNDFYVPQVFNEVNELLQKIFREQQIKFYEADKMTYTYKLFKYKPMIPNCPRMFEKLHIFKNFKHYLIGLMIVLIC